MSLQHEDHLLLGLLEQTGKFDADLISKLIKLFVFLLDKVDEGTDLALEVVETLTD